MDSYVSETVDRLHRVRETAWFALRPVIDHAIALAKEAEYQAARASNEVQAGISPAYPPLVVLLAESVAAVEGRRHYRADHLRRDDDAPGAITGPCGKKGCGCPEFEDLP